MTMKNCRYNWYNFVEKSYNDPLRFIWKRKVSIFTFVSFVLFENDFTLRGRLKTHFSRKIVEIQTRVKTSKIVFMIHDGLEGLGF